MALRHLVAAVFTSSPQIMPPKSDGVMSGLGITDTPGFVCTRSWQKAPRLACQEASENRNRVTRGALLPTPHPPKPSMRRRCTTATRVKESGASLLSGHTLYLFFFKDTLLRPARSVKKKYAPNPTLIFGSVKEGLYFPYFNFIYQIMVRFHVGLRASKSL